MAKFCGTKLEEENGKCPNCDNTGMNRHNQYNENEKTTKPKEQILETETNNKKKINISVIIAASVILLSAIVVILLFCFNIINIPFLSIKNKQKEEGEESIVSTAVIEDNYTDSETTASSNEKPTEKKKVDLCISEFETMLNTSGIYLTGGADFSKISTSELITDYVVGLMSCGFYRYYSESDIHFTGKDVYPDGNNCDPKKKYYISYEVLADEVDWILKNVFDRKPDRTISNDDLYYYGKNVYVNVPDLGGGPESLYNVESYKLIGENKYEIYVSSYVDTGSFDPSGNYKFIVSPEYDSQKGIYWKLYSYSIVDSVSY